MITEAGIQPVGLSYDEVEILEKFSSSKNIQFPLLSDPDSKVIKSLGILNTKGKEGTKKYNLAHPMTILINTDRTVAGSIPATTRKRHDSKKLVDAWKSAAQKAESQKKAAK